MPEPENTADESTANGSASSMAPRAATRSSAAAWGPPGLGALVGPLCLVALAGLALPPQFGLALPLVFAAGLGLIGERRARIIATAGGLHQASPAARVCTLVLAVIVSGLLLTMLSRGVGALLAEFPAAIWGAGVMLLIGIAWALVGRRLPARARPVVLLALAVLVPVAGVAGTRHEAEGADSRGFAHSGPVLGIHPFQITSVIVDGYGPYDLPINDYVEPDGSRGYGPEALGDFFDRSLQSIADRVYADGPLRAYRAFADAEVEVVQTDAVWERLDRPPHEEVQSRFIVRSGSFGAQSRVEFVCPGRRIDPRGPKGESVMNRMCPDKYAAEASAGLGVTGRWSGYSEGRGVPRSGISRWMHWTRTDKGSAAVVERETRWWALAVLAVMALCVMTPVLGVGVGVRGAGGALAAMTIVAAIVVSFSAAGVPAVGAWERGPTWDRWTDLSHWLPALALAGTGLFALGRTTASDGEASTGRVPAGGRAVLAVAVLLAVLAIAVASSLPALNWIHPVLPSGARLPDFVHGLADAIGERGGLTIFEVEGAVAAGLVGMALGGGMALIVTVRQAATRLVPTTGTMGLVLTVGATLAIAAAFVVSRKTSGAVALVPSVVGMTLVLGSCALRISQPARARALGLVIHLTWTALGVALAVVAMAPHTEERLVVLYAGVGLVAVLAAAIATALPSASADRPSALEPSAD